MNVKKAMQKKFIIHIWEYIERWSLKCICWTFSHFDIQSVCNLCHHDISVLPFLSCGHPGWGFALFSRLPGLDEILRILESSDGPGPSHTSCPPSEQEKDTSQTLVWLDSFRPLSKIFSLSLVHYLLCGGGDNALLQPVGLFLQIFTSFMVP